MLLSFAVFIGVSTRFHIRILYLLIRLFTVYTTVALPRGSITFFDDFYLRFYTRY